jgi:ligand-binding sensor domain-containing protein/signal transduction histidine kinase
MDLLNSRPALPVRRLPGRRRAHAPALMVCVLWLGALVLIPPLDARAQQLPIKTYTTADGLPHNSVHRIVKDSRGFLWFCTNEGLARFDSYAFTNFGIEQGLPSSAINDLLETRAGEYWVATDRGLVRFDPRGMPGTRTSRETNPSPRVPMFTVVPVAGEITAARAVTVVREGRDGTIWAGTDNGLYRLVRGNGLVSLRYVEVGFPNENREQRFVADVLEDARGSLWIAAPSGLYRRWPDGSAARYGQRDGLPSAYLQDLLEDHDGRLWAGTPIDGFFRFAADDSHRKPVVDLAFSEPDLPSPWVFQLLETSDHRFWIATARGVAEFFPTGDDRGRRFRAYSTRNGLSYYDVTALTEDAAGNLWLGTNSAGAMKLALNRLTAYGERDGLRQVSSVFNDRSGNLCFRGLVLGDAHASVFEGGRLDLVSTDQPGYYQRVGCFDGSRFTGFQPRSIRPVGWGWVSEGLTLQTRRGEWWIGTGQGLYRFPAGDRLDALRTSRPLAVYTPKDGLATWQMYRLFEDSRGDVWISSIASDRNGLARWDHRTARVIDMAGSPGLPSLKEKLPRAFGEDAAGNLWVGFDGELARCRGGTFELLTSSNGVPPGAVRDIHRDRAGRLWLASASSGLVRIDEATTERPRFSAYTIAQNISSNDIEAVTEDLDGRIYAAGARGVDRLAPATGHVEHFTTADGLAPGRFRDAFRDRDGVLWFGTTTGLTRLAPTPERPAGPPPVLISGVRVDGVPESISALGEQDVSLGELAPDQNQVQIDFVGLGFGSGNVLRYQYKLQGADADWSAPSEQRSVTYASLAPGRYTFVVRAVNTDGIARAQSAAIAFTILRPVWQRAWFLAIGVLLLGAMIYAAHRYRLGRLLEMANLRTRIATDLHDDIGANLTRIALLSQVATQTSIAIRPMSGPSQGVLDIAAEGGPLASIARIARESVSSMSDIVWAINPSRETLLDLTRRMRQHADEIFTLRNIELRFDAPEARPDLRLGVDVRRDVLLIFKESVNNAARHSGCTRVDIDFRVDRSRLLLSVADNGAGFDTSLESEGQGLMSMKRRARRLKGTLDLRSANGRGTTVTLTVPL